MFKKKRLLTKKRFNFYFFAGKRRLFKKLAYIGWILVILIFFGLIVWALTGNYFKIKTIDCQLDSFPCPPEANIFFEPAYGKNLILLNAWQLADGFVKKNPRFLKVDIKKNFPNQLEIKIAPRVPLAILKNKKNLTALIDENGFVIERQENIKTNLPIIEVNLLPPVGEAVVDSNLLTALKLAQNLGWSYLPFIKISLLIPDSLQVDLPNNLVATFSAKKDIKHQVDSLQYLLSHSRMGNETIRGIDLRFKKPVIKVDKNP